MYVNKNEQLIICKSHRRVIQCDQQQHRYIVSFDR